jgi:hypothetical protein
MLLSEPDVLAHDFAGNFHAAIGQFAAIANQLRE